MRFCVFFLSLSSGAQCVIVEWELPAGENIAYAMSISSSGQNVKVPSDVLALEVRGASFGEVSSLCKKWCDFRSPGNGCLLREPLRLASRGEGVQYITLALVPDVEVTHIAFSPNGEGLIRFTTDHVSHESFFESSSLSDRASICTG